MTRSRLTGHVAAVGLLLAACGGGGEAGAAAPRPPRPVQLVTVATAELPRKVPVTGVLAAQEELVLGLEVAGRLQSVPVDVGDAVTADTGVGALASREFELAEARAAAAVSAAESRLGRGAGVDLDAFVVEDVPAVREARAVVVEATLHRDRTAQMVQEKMQPESVLESAAAALAVAESRLQRARDDVQSSIADVRLRRVELLQAQKRRADSVVKAPWAGRVAVRHAIAGQVLAAGAPVVTLLRIDPLRLRLRVPDRLATEVRIGQEVEFTVDGDARPHLGRVVRAGPAIERGDRTRLVEAEVANPDGVLLPGAFCRANIVVAEAVPVVVVPKTAVVAFAGVERVFTVEVGKDGASKAQGVIVELGRELGADVEVVQGIAAGARVVRDAKGLAPQAPVAVEK
ncbi:MAG: efflux RND transporter periplasmic adaptor subunit [Planctomycetes bacterium]|nr:efflux RND transporter periplasmic adaptor subunit [Planctomycetota bacterium]